jgi:hypothetical protein
MEITATEIKILGSGHRCGRSLRTTIFHTDIDIDFDENFVLRIITRYQRYFDLLVPHY